MKRYVCELCRIPFFSDQTEDEAKLRYMQAHPDKDPDDTAIVCQECHDFITEYIKTIN